MQTFSTFFLCISAMLICTIDFYHFAPVKVTITLAVGHKVSTKQNNYVTIIFCEEGEN